MMAQAGGYDELMEMAPYQQKAVADAMGMTVDEMISAAQQQKNLNDMAKDLGITLDENGKMSEEDMKKAMNSTSEEAKKLALQQQQNSASEKMAALSDKISIIWGGIASIILPIVDAIASMATLISDGIGGSLEFVKQLWTDIAPYVEGIATTIAIMLVPSLATAAASMTMMAFEALPGILTAVGTWVVQQWGVASAAAVAAISAITSASALTLGLGALAIAGGIAVAAAAMHSEEDKAEKMDDGMIDPDGGLIVKGKKGSFQLNKDDSVIAGTSLGEASRDTSGGSSYAAPASGNAEVVALLKELIAKVDQPVNINIGGRVVQELDRMITMNKTYNTKGDNTYGAT
jgi:hypothetical protein